jgi:hypothetical protein
MTYKIIYWRPAIQQGGLYEVYQDYYWVTNARLRQLKKILQCTSRDSLMDHFDYDMSIEVDVGAPQAGRFWGYKFVLYPVNKGVPETEYKGWIVGTQNQDTSVAFEIEQLLAEWSDDAAGQTHFTY